jgi:rhodanese-related sulfurtransferase
MDEPARIQQMYEGYRTDFPDVPGVSALELGEQAAEKALVLVDVRTPEEQRVSMIPGALTQEEFEAGREQYRDASIVAYCTIGARSGKFAAEQMKQGFHVRNLEGGILAWTHASGPLVGPDGPTRKVHVYGRRWNLAADGYESVW